MKKLWLKNSDISALTSLSGNIDADNLLPHIYTAQTTEIKRVLTLPLYTYYDNLIQAGTPITDATYKKIFDDYIVDMLVYYSCSNYMAFGGYKIANAGNYKQTTENATVVDDKEIQRLINRFTALGASVELAFQEYMKTQNIPEFKSNSDSCENRVIGWF